MKKKSPATFRRKTSLKKGRELNGIDAVDADVKINSASECQPKTEKEMRPKKRSSLNKGSRPAKRVRIAPLPTESTTAERAEGVSADETKDGGALKMVSMATAEAEVPCVDRQAETCEKSSDTAEASKEDMKFSLDPYLLDDSVIDKQASVDDAWTNKQRVLVFCGRGVTHRHRHLMEDLKRILPHSKSEPKWEKKSALSEINEICEMQSCNSCLYFETRKSTELYLWLARTPDGPSVKFQVLNVHTLGELKMTGNCLLHSRPFLVFDKAFSETPALKLMRELFIQVFGTPRNHPKSKPFFDHVISLFFHDNKIWFRHYQISPMVPGKDDDNPDRQLLTEIGPRFVLDPIKIFDESFGGKTIYENAHYVTPTATRLLVSRGLGSKYASRVATKHQRKIMKQSFRRGPDPLAPQSIFLGGPVN